MASGLPSVLTLIAPMTKANLWRLRDENEHSNYESESASSSQLYSIGSPTGNPLLKHESNGTQNLISPRAKLVLTKAAKRTVLQQQILLKANPLCNRRLIKTSESSRRRSTKLKSNVVHERSEVYSAPPILGKGPVSKKGLVYKPPKIVVIGASQESLFGYTGNCPNDDNFVENRNINSAPNLKEKNSPPVELPSVDFIPQSSLSSDSSNFLGAYSPDARDGFGSKGSCRSPGSTPSLTDWEWVRERLASRESALQRPETSMTFDDFLDTFLLDSDEYDTDLEEDFEYLKVKKDDETGLRKYQEVCLNKVGCRELQDFVRGAARTYGVLKYFSDFCHHPDTRDSLVEFWSLSGIPLTKQIVQNLSNKNVEFTLKHRFLNQQDAEAIAKALTHSRIVETVNLTGNNINDEAAKPLLSMLCDNSYIRRFDLSNNCIARDDRGYIPRILKENTTLSHLFLGGNQLGDKGALLLSEALKDNYSLQHLSLSHNRLSEVGGQAIAAALIDNVFLTSLDLSWNILGKLAASALCKALRANRTLLSLDLSYNGFGDEGAALFSRCLRHNSTLRLLSLAVNHIGSFGGERLAMCLSGNKKKGKKSKSNIKSLNLNRNPLGKKSVLILLQYMEQSAALQELRIEDVVVNASVVQLIKKLTVIREVSIFYEGQEKENKQLSAIRFGAKLLKEVLHNQLQLKEFFKTFDPDHKGLTTLQIKSALERLNATPSELEMDRLLTCLSSKHHNCVRYNDLPSSATTSLKPIPVKPKKISF